jgi:predicted AAA+ superfamily ATPase
MSLRDLIVTHNPWLSEPSARPEGLPPGRRDVVRHLRERLRASDPRAIVVRGPRQVGKTTALRQLAFDLLDEGWPPGRLVYFDLDDDRLPGEFGLEDLAQGLPIDPASRGSTLLLLDEVGQDERWDRWLKRAVDRRLGRLVVTDSSANLLQSGSRESGHGRWDDVRLEGLTLAEYARLSATPESLVIAGSPATLTYLDVGGFPEFLRPMPLAMARARLRTDVIDRAIRRDLYRYHRGLNRLEQLARYVTTTAGGEFSARKVASEIGGESGQADARTVARHLDALEDAMLVAILPRRSRSGSARLPKVYPIDHGLITAFSPLPDPLADPRTRGSVVETAVFRHLRSIPGVRLSYYRERGREIDFVADAGAGVVAIEVTASATPRPEKVDSLRRCAVAIGASRTMIIHGGDETDTEAGLWRVSLVDFLKAPARFLGIET